MQSENSINVIKSSIITATKKWPHEAPPISEGEQNYGDCRHVMLKTSSKIHNFWTVSVLCIKIITNSAKF